MQRSRLFHGQNRKVMHPAVERITFIAVHGSSLHADAGIGGTDHGPDLGTSRTIACPSKLEQHVRMSATMPQPAPYGITA